jgi:O-methyltransferase
MKELIPPKIRYRLGTIRKKTTSRFIPKHRAIAIAEDCSLSDRNRLLGLQRVAEQVAKGKLTGDLVECGVFRGGSAVVIAERLLPQSPERKIWLFDCFEGMPDPGVEDPPEAWEYAGKFASSELIVLDTFKKSKLPLNQVEIVVGRYEDVLPTFKPFPISLLHIDCDWYDPVKLCLKTFYEWVVSGGAIVFDDYGFWSGCRKAVDEFLAEHSIDIRLTAIDSTSHYFFKP